MSWSEYYKCANGHIGLRPPIYFIVGDKQYQACSQECRNEVEKRERESGGSK